MKCTALVILFTIFTFFNYALIEARYQKRVKRQEQTCIPATRSASCQLTYTTRGYNFGPITINQREGCGNQGPLTITVGNIEPGTYALYIGEKLTCSDEKEDAKKIAEFTAVNRILDVQQVQTNLKSIFDVKNQRISLVKISTESPQNTNAYACGRFAKIL